MVKDARNIVQDLQKTVCTDDIKFRQYRLFFSEKVYRADFYILQITLKTRPFTLFFYRSRSEVL